MGGGRERREGERRRGREGERRREGEAPKTLFCWSLRAVRVGLSGSQDAHNSGLAWWRFSQAAHARRGEKWAGVGSQRFDCRRWETPLVTFCGRARREPHAEVTSGGWLLKAQGRASLKMVEWEFSSVRKCADLLCIFRKADAHHRRILHPSEPNVFASCSVCSLTSMWPKSAFNAFNTVCASVDEAQERLQCLSHSLCSTTGTARFSENRWSSTTGKGDETTG